LNNVLENFTSLAKA